MFYKKFKTIAIAAVIASLLLIGFVVKSEAIEIVSLSGNSEAYNYGDGNFYCYAVVETDVPIYQVSWSIDNEVVYSETLDSTTKFAYFYPNTSDCPGHIKGDKYEVGVTVWEWDAEAEKFRSNSSGYDLTVFQPMFTSEVQTPPKKHESVSGYSELNRQYYDGNNITIDCYVSASNSKGVRRTAYSRFKHNLTGRAEIVREDPFNAEGNIEPKRIGPNFGSYSHSDSLTHYNVGDLQNRDYTSDAYIRLVVQGVGGEDHYFVGNDEMFGPQDKPYDAP